MVGWFTSHDIASCEGGRKGVRGRDRGKQRERERERGLQLWAAALGCAAFQSRLHLSRAINASFEDEVRIFVLKVVVASKTFKEKGRRKISTI